MYFGIRLWKEHISCQRRCAEPTLSLLFLSTKLSEMPHLHYMYREAISKCSWLWIFIYIYIYRLWEKANGGMITSITQLGTRLLFCFFCCPILNLLLKNYSCVSDVRVFYFLSNDRFCSAWKWVVWCSNRKERKKTDCFLHIAMVHEELIVLTR